MRTTPLTLALVWLSTALGCSSSPDEDSSARRGSASARESDVRALVGSEGAILELSSGTTLEIPRDALSSEVEIALAEVTRDQVRAPDPTDARTVERPVVLRPHGQRFERPVRVTLPLRGGGAELPASELRVLRLDDEIDDTWERGPELRVVDDAAGVRSAEFEVSRFSIYAIAQALAAGELPEPGAGTSDGGSTQVPGGGGTAGLDASVGAPMGGDGGGTTGSGSTAGSTASVGVPTGGDGGDSTGGPSGTTGSTAPPDGGPGVTQDASASSPDGGPGVTQDGSFSNPDAGDDSF